MDTRANKQTKKQAKATDTNIPLGNDTYMFAEFIVQLDRGVFNTSLRFLFDQQRKHSHILMQANAGGDGLSCVRG